MNEERESVRCAGCCLMQFRTEIAKCRRCGKPLQRGSVETTTIILVAAPRTGPNVITPMRKVMQDAAVEALKVNPHTTKAARELGIPHSRLKQLLRESGDDTDYRKDRRKRQDENTAAS
jgi:hypothetical protein